MAIGTTRLSSKGQVVIPKRIREELGLKPGDDLVMVRQDDLIIVMKPSLEKIIAETDRQYEAGETLSIEGTFAGLT
jgi:AbrB family looped-hinge helix DNA binding protein